MHDSSSQEKKSRIGNDEFISSYPVYALVMECARAIQDGELKQADEALGRCLKEAEELQCDRLESPWVRVGKFFAQALVRYIYNIRPPTAPTLPWSRFESTPFSYLGYEMMKRTIVAGLDAKNKDKVHLIDLFYLDQRPRRYYLRDLARDLKPKRALRVTVVLLTGDASQISNYDDLIQCGFEVVSVRELMSVAFFASHVFRKEKMEDELVVVNSFFSLHGLLPLGELENVLRLVRVAMRPDFMITSEHYYPDLSSSSFSFSDRVGHLLRYYARFPSLTYGRVPSQLCASMEWWAYLKAEISTILFPPHDDMTCHRWRDLLLSQGFAPVPLQSNFVEETRNEMHKYADSGWVEEEDNSAVFTCYKLPLSFISVWEPSNTTAIRLHQIVPSPLLAPSFTAIHKLSPHCHPSYKNLNKTAALVEIFDVLPSICHKHKFPLALLWTPETINDGMLRDGNEDLWNKYNFTMDRINWYRVKINLELEICSAEYYMVKLQDLARTTLQSNRCFAPSMTYRPMSLSSDTAVVSMKLRMSYITHSVYVVQFLVLDHEMGVHSQNQDKLMNTLASDMQQQCKSLSTFSGENLFPNHGVRYDRANQPEDQIIHKRPNSHLLQNQSQRRARTRRNEDSGDQICRSTPRTRDDFFGKLHRRVSLSMTFWSDTKTSSPFCRLTSHFINGDWKLDKKVIGFRSLGDQSNVKAELFLSEYTKNVVSEWNISKSLLSMTVKSAFGSAEMVTKLKRWLTDQNWLLVNGDLFHIDCFVHIINLMVREILQEIDNVLHKIRLCITLRAKTEAEAPRLSLDDQTKWDSTYLMLKTALELRDREAFFHLKESDHDMKINPSIEEWDKAVVVSKYLKVLYDLLRGFEGSGNKLTANVYFSKASETYVNLMNWGKSSYAYVREMSRRMKLKFDEYWKKCSLVLVAAVVLDPRYKFLIVELVYKEIHGRNAGTKMSEIRNALRCIFDEYATNKGRVSSSSEFFSYNVMKNFRKYKKTVFVTCPESELDVYLEEPTLDVEDVKFDILDWWCINSKKYPVLGKMARDILAIPMSLCEPDSLFTFTDK